MDAKCNVDGHELTYGRSGVNFKITNLQIGLLPRLPAVSSIVHRKFAFARGTLSWIKSFLLFSLKIVYVHKYDDMIS